MTPTSADLTEWLLGSLDADTTLFHLGQYCGRWASSTAGLGRASFHLVLQRGCDLVLPEEDRRVELDRGDAVFLLRDAPFMLTGRGDAAPPPLGQSEMQPLAPDLANGTGLACGFFQFRPGLAGLLLRALPPWLVLRSYDPAQDDCRAVFAMIRREALEGRPPSTALIERLAGVLLFYALRHVLAGPGPASPSVLALLRRAEFAPLVERLLATPGGDWTMETMAATVHMSRAAFCRKFNEVAGVSPGHFLLCLRMQAAERLLRDGQAIAQVAEQVGYRSVAAFARAFQKTSGVQPGAFRRGVAGT